ncbi:hypothetical protein AALP_AA6G337500 [Arabis alpina]|uniref:Plasma membrane ATPase n=1 Tax=Arabis alpina TaxID=50452 RepID=A0A087GTF0_ARAAL|nr:hypothetical protein AALP_AA6G337500 [Arabis alpina]
MEEPVDLEMDHMDKFPNHEKVSKIFKFFVFMCTLCSLAMVATAIMALVLANGGGKPTDWQDFVGIIVLLLINSTIGFMEQKKAGIAKDALMAHLAPKTMVRRDGEWFKEDASILVPGDVIRIKAGDKIPADCRLLQGDPLKIDQSALTGESLPITKISGDKLNYGSTCKQGEIDAVKRHWSPLQNSGYGEIPVAMPTLFFVIMASGCHQLSQQGVITNTFTALEEMAGMDILLIDRTGTLTLNKLSVDRNLIEVYAESVDRDVVVLMAARASRVEDQDAIDAAINGMLKDPKEARAGIQEIHFLPFNRKDRRTALTYIDNEGKMHRVSKGAPEQILNLVHNKSEIEHRVHCVIDKYAEQGLRSIAVAYQEVPEGTKESPGDPWQFIGIIPLLDSPRHDSAETIRRALDLGVNVKMITGDHLAIGKETGHRLGLGKNMYPSAVLGNYKYFDLFEDADGFTSVFPEHRCEILDHLQIRKHICGMTGDGVDDVPALKKADIGIAVADATDAARKASDIFLTKPGLSGIISVILTSRAIYQRMKNCTTYAVSITVRIVLAFFLITIIWEFDFPPFMVLIIAIFNYGTIMTISKDRVKPSPQPDRWNMAEIFRTGIIRTFKVTSLQKKDVKDLRMLASALYLQVSISSQALIFVTRTRGWSYAARPGTFLMTAFVVAQLITTLIAVYANWGFASMQGIGWRWAGVIWLYNLIFYIPLDPLKLFIQYIGRERSFKRDAHQLRWAHALRTLHGRDLLETRVTEHNNDGIQQHEGEDGVATEHEEAPLLPDL